MANNRLYLVDTDSGEYLCLAKSNGYNWLAGNEKLYRSFLAWSCDGMNTKTTLILGSETDNDFYSKWIQNGVNYNSENIWKYCKHESIIMVTEKPRDSEGNMQIGRTFVECESCKEILPIHRVTKEDRII